jgi:23S rRNA pseudouridine1911/1915/1917 synthase
VTFFHPRWPVFYEDNHLLVIYKPAGLIMQRDIKEKANLLDLAKLWLKVRYAKPGRVFVGMVHRLDGPVAGVLVLARTSKAAARLSAQFREGLVSKTYLAVVRGRPPAATERLYHHLERSGRLSRIVPSPAIGSQAAALVYRLLETRDQDSLVEVLPETGRRHQIRLQLATVGCPILGDRSYGAAEPLDNGRIALIAHKLGFEHPTRRTAMQFETPLPQGWPWPNAPGAENRPLWAVADFRREGLVLPSVHP